MVLVRVVSEPTRGHVCDGLSVRLVSRWWAPSLDNNRRCLEGTVAECSCGRTWVAGRQDGRVASIWRPEGRVERWFRERKDKLRPTRHARKAARLRAKLTALQAQQGRRVMFAEGKFTDEEWQRLQDGWEAALDKP